MKDLPITYEEACQMNKEFWGFETFEAILCDISIKMEKENVEKLEAAYPSTTINYLLKKRREELKYWEDRFEHFKAIMEKAGKNI